MKKLLFLALLFPFGAFAQVFTNPFLYLGHDPGIIRSKELYLSTAYELGSNSLPNKFFNNYVFSNFIGQDIKDAGDAKLKGDNRIGAYVESMALYAWRHSGYNSASSPLYFYVGLKGRTQLGIRFPADAYRLALYGNSRFAGKAVTLNNINVQQANYQVLYAGFYKALGADKVKKWIAGGGVGVVKGTSASQLEINNGSFYTAGYGDSVALSGKIDSRTSNLKGNFYDIGGWGLAANFFIGYKPGNKSNLQLAITDIGFVNWRPAVSNVYTYNGTLSFTGISFDLDSSVSANSTSVLDSLQKEFTASNKQGGFNTFLPMQIQALYSTEISRKTQIIGMIEYFPLSNHIPSLHALLRHKLTKNFALTEGVRFSGNSVYGIMLRAEIKVLPKFTLSLGTSHLEGLVYPTGTTGQGLFISLTGKP